MKKINLVFDKDYHVRIDKFLASISHNELYSRSYIEKLISNGNVLVNQKIIKKNFLLQENDHIEIELLKKQHPMPIPQDISLEVIFEDKHLIVINKTAGMTVHPAPGNYDSTLVNALMFHFKDQLSNGSDPLRPGIVHRLDKDTSGLLIVAKNDKVHSLLSTMFQERKIEKYYKAILVGVPKETEGTIKTFINRSKIDRKKMAVSDEGKLAITHYQIEQRFFNFCIADVNLETGRTHQIRVHFSHINCPVLGDQTYSSLKRTLANSSAHYHKKTKYLFAHHLKRQALHAYKLKFVHPITQKNIEVVSPLPEDMLYTIDWMKKLM